MSTTQWVLVGVVTIPLILVLLNRLRADIAALAMASLLGILQFLGMGVLGPVNTPGDTIKAISGFSQPVVVTLMSLFILTHGLERSGLTRWLAGQITRVSGKSESRLIVLFASLTALLSLFMNNLAAGALVLPSAMEASRRSQIRPSKLLIPVAYGSLLGGSATYFTTANIIMSDLLRSAVPAQTPLHIFDFVSTGGLIALAGIVFLGLFGKRILPNREPAAEQAAARRSGNELENIYQISERLWDAQVLTGSSLVGETLAQSQIGSKYGVSVAAIRRHSNGLVLPKPDEVFTDGDVLLLVGREEKILLLKSLGLEISPAKQNGKSVLRGSSFFEIILAPHSQMEGKNLKQIDFRQKFSMSVIALKRLTRSYRTDVGDIALNLGDSLLAIGKLDQISSLRKSQDFILFEIEPEEEPVNKRQAILSVALIALAVAASIAGVPIYLTMLAGAVLMLILKVLPIEETYQSIEWEAVFLIAGMYAVSLAMVQTGLAEILGKSIFALVQPFGGLGLAAAAYLLTALLTQVMGGQVTALVTGPIAISAAVSMGINPQAVAVATAIGCSASFFTPMAHPVNILMIAPANYRFIDFVRAGWILTLISFVMLMAGLVLFWHL